jgi:hypothetical protein
METKRITALQTLLLALLIMRLKSRERSWPRGSTPSAFLPAVQILKRNLTFASEAFQYGLRLAVTLAFIAGLQCDIEVLGYAEREAGSTSLDSPAHQPPVQHFKEEHRLCGSVGGAPGRPTSVPAHRFELAHLGGPAVNNAEGVTRFGGVPQATDGFLQTTIENVVRASIHLCESVRKIRQHPGQNGPAECYRRGP